jgi:hypothetical protein
LRLVCHSLAISGKLELNEPYEFFERLQIQQSMPVLAKDLTAR